MPGRRITPRERILRAARKRFRQGDRPSVEAIAAAAGVSRATFYRAVGSRQALLRELDLEPDATARTRILEAALERISLDGLARLSMDAVAERASVSRATLYRLFPGKPALFRELLRVYSPLEPVAELVARMRDRPPEDVMPAIARTVFPVIAARIGVFRTFFFEMVAMEPDTDEVARFLFSQLAATMVPYLTAQMRAGRLRRMHPVLALQAFVGPIFLHLFTRALLHRVIALDVPAEEAIDELVRNWLRGMRPQARP